MSSFSGVHWPAAGLALASCVGCAGIYGLDVPVRASSDAGRDAIMIDGDPSDGLAQNFHVRFEAYLDGRSNAIFKNATVQWQHFQFSAPGRALFVNEPTRFDSIDWLPMWPDVPDAENRDCNCLSSTYTAVPASIPRVPATATLTVITARKQPAILEQPSAANDYTLLVEMSDVGFGGAAWYTVDIDVVVQ